MELPTLLVSVFEVSFILRYGREEMQAGRTFARLRLWLSIIVMPQEAAEKRATRRAALTKVRAPRQNKGLIGKTEEAAEKVGKADSSRAEARSE